MKTRSKLIAALTLLVSANTLFAQSATTRPPENVVQLSASATVEVPQDLLSISMTTSRSGPDAQVLQTQLKSAMDTALAEVKKEVVPGQLEVRTGNFSLYPRYDRDGKSIGWQGSAELILEGRDFARISAAAGKLQTLTVAQVSFSLSREQRARVGGDAQSMAIDRFKTNARTIAQGFGFTGYTLREINVNANDQSYAPAPRVMAMAAKSAMADAPVPVEAGKTAVVVTVSGSVQLQ